MASKLYRPLDRAVDEFRLLVFCPPDPLSSRHASGYALSR